MKVSFKGAGASGTAAALAAAEGGAKVVVLEKTPSVGGAGRIASGLFAVESKLQKEKFKNQPELLKELTADKLYSALMDYNHYLSNARITRRVIDQSASTIDWMDKHGAKLELVDWNPQQGQNPYPLRWRIYHRYVDNGTAFKNMYTIDWMDKHGAKLELVDWNPQQGQNPYPLRWRIYHRYVDNGTAFKNMYESLGRMGGRLLTETRAYDLTFDKDGAVSAVIAEKADGSKLTVKTKAVILASRMGGRLLTETRAYDLTFDKDGAVSAVIAEKADGSKLTVKTKAVILASGGYGGNLSRLSTKMESDQLTNRIAWSNNGEGIDMALKAGASPMGEHSALIHAAEFDGLSTSSAGSHGMVEANLLVRVLKTPLMWVDPAGRRFANEELHAAEFDGLSTSSAGSHGMVEANLLVRVLKTPLMWVDPAGRRFANEELIYDTVYWANAGYSVGGRYYIIVDGKTLDAYTADQLPFEVSGAGPDNPKGKGDFRVLADEAVRQGVAFRADSLEDLAKQVGFTKDFVSEVAQYNEAVRSGKDALGKPAEFLKFEVKDGPFYALRAKVVSLSTLGGVRVNENMEVLSKTHRPIKGLYAVGNNAYGFYSAPSYPPYQGLALGFAYNSGRIAGTEAAKTIVGEK